MKAPGYLALFMTVAMAGCSSESRSPEAIRRDTAHVTTTAARDAKAVALGVVDGLKHHADPVNINTANAAEIKALPGLSNDTAERIVLNRPYSSPQDLVRRRLVTKAEFNLIADKIVTK